jgi:hypothetical protein
MEPLIMGLLIDTNSPDHYVTSRFVEKEAERWASLSSAR